MILLELTPSEYAALQEALEVAAEALGERTEGKTRAAPGSPRAEASEARTRIMYLSNSLEYQRERQ